MLAQFKYMPYLCTQKTSRSGAVVARWAHNPKVVGSNPSSATQWQPFRLPFFFVRLGVPSFFLRLMFNVLSDVAAGVLPIRWLRLRLSRLGIVQTSLTLLSLLHPLVSPSSVTTRHSESKLSLCFNGLYTPFGSPVIGGQKRCSIR